MTFRADDLWSRGLKARVTTATVVMGTLSASMNAGRVAAGGVSSGHAHATEDTYVVDENGDRLIL